MNQCPAKVQVSEKRRESDKTLFRLSLIKINAAMYTSYKPWKHLDLRQGYS